jgi:hypothetical protein
MNRKRQFMTVLDRIHVSWGVASAQLADDTQKGTAHYWTGNMVVGCSCCLPGRSYTEKSYSLLDRIHGILVIAATVQYSPGRRYIAGEYSLLDRIRGSYV